MAGTARDIAIRMAETLRHRGPDDAGAWEDQAAGLALAHRRLSIIDTSAGGHQPMVSRSGRFVVSYNGEIYNFPALRQQLATVGQRFQSSSDTEVLLAAIEHWGLEAAVRRLVGMFAFALWDRETRNLSLVRDRAGEKPLYYGVVAGGLAFASELRAFRRIPGFDGLIATEALACYLNRGHVPAPLTIFRSVAKLLPGHFATVGVRDGAAIDVSTHAYWRAEDAFGCDTPMPYESARERAWELLDSAVRSQMISDVPLGAFLSGGFDSTAVVTLMQRASMRPVRTFSIGSTESDYDESGYAAAVAAHLGTDHTELRLTAGQAQAVVPELGGIYDEPFADSSQIATLLVCRLARGEVTVALSGDAGDEVFGGYNRYTLGPGLWRRIRSMPAPVRRAASAAIRWISAPAWESLGRAWSGISGRQVPGILGERMHKLARALPAGTHIELYRRLAACWLDVPLPGSPSVAPIDWAPLPARLRSPDDFARAMMFLDFTTYLPDDILVKVDRASMSASLECRVPMLDHRLVEFTAGLPLEHKIGGSGSKRILRDLVYAHLPRELMDRPKSGFGVPIDVWLRGPLRDWAESLLDPIRLSQQGYLEVQPLMAAWREHLAGRRPRHHELWSVLMFQAWLETGGDA